MITPEPSPSGSKSTRPFVLHSPSPSPSPTPSTPSSKFPFNPIRCLCSRKVLADDAIVVLVVKDKSMFTKSTIITGTKFVKPHVLPKARSSSPVATSTGEHYANVQEIIRRISINNPKQESEEKSDNSAHPSTDIPPSALNTSIGSSTEEEEDKDSSIPVAKVSLLLQNDCEALKPAGQMKFRDTILSSVFKRREFFNRQFNSAAYQSSSSTQSYQVKQKSLSMEVTNDGPPLPPRRPPPHPERYIKSQLRDWHSVRSVKPVESIMGDSSLSSNPNLNRRDSSDASFSDEDEEHQVQQVCSFPDRCISLHSLWLVANETTSMPRRSSLDRENLCRYSVCPRGQALR